MTQIDTQEPASTINKHSNSQEQKDISVNIRINALIAGELKHGKYDPRNLPHKSFIFRDYINSYYESNITGTFHH